MRNKFSILSIVTLAASIVIFARVEPIAAQEAASPGGSFDVHAGGTASGDVLLDSAITTIEKHKSISARVRLQMQLYGHKLYGSGLYLQRGRGPGRQVRLDLSIQGTNHKHELSHVRDGERLWLFENLAGEPRLQLVDLSRITDDANRDSPAAGLSTGGLSTGGLSVSGDLAAGGLPQLLHSLQREFQFGRAVQTQWNGLGVWMTRGTWRQDQAGAVSTSATGKRASPQNDMLPDRVPRGVNLIVDAQTLSPYRVEYFGYQRIRGRDKLTSLMTMEWFEVHLDEAIDASQFSRPSNLVATDVTQAYLERLGLIAPPDDAQ